MAPLAGRSIAVVTGAGISAESGVPTFRGHGGLWNDYNPRDLATQEAFHRDPELVWEWYAWRRKLIATSQPNAAHETLAEMERTVKDFTLITQNVDGLHQTAGSRRVLELHGNIWRLRCIRCGHRTYDRRVPLPDLPPRCPSCGGLVRPDVVWFGESLPHDVLDAARLAAERCNVMLIVGTSATVEPAASLPLVALRHGARPVEVNPEETGLSDTCHEVLHEPAGEGLPRWWSLHRR